MAEPARAAGPLDRAPSARFLNRLMIKGLAQMLCRFLAALVCLLCASELFSSSRSAAAFQSESELRVAGGAEETDTKSELPDSREEREEREQDDEDDGVDDSREAPWLSVHVHPCTLGLAAFRRALDRDAPRPSHLSLDPRPPRRA